MSTEGTSTQALAQGLERGGLQLRQLLGEIRKVIVGQDVLLERLALGLLTRGHVLLEGVPGLGKTLAVGDFTIWSDGRPDPVAHATVTYAIPRKA